MDLKSSMDVASALACDMPGCKIPYPGCYGARVKFKNIWKVLLTVTVRDFLFS